MTDLRHNGTTGRHLEYIGYEYVILHFAEARSSSMCHGPCQQVYDG